MTKRSLSRPTTRRTVLRTTMAGLALIAGFAGTAPAAARLNGSQKETLGRINQYFNSIRTMHGEFVQFGPTGERSEGKFFLSRPGRVRFDYAKPARIDIVADGESVAVRDTKLNTQDVWPLKKTPLRFLLSDRIDLTSDAKITEVYVEPDLVTVVIEEDTTFGSGKLTLLFDARNHELKQWTVTDAQGDTSVAIYNVEVGKPTNPKLFKIDYRNFLLDRHNR